MQLSEAISLINSEHLNQSVPAEWADLGCGSGLFSHALAHFLPEGSRIHAIDKAVILKPQVLANGVQLLPAQKDFVTDELALPPLDGVLMANALHYVKDKPLLIEKLKRALKTEGCFLIVEYDTDKPVPVWVPYPTSFSTLSRLFQSAGYRSVEKLGERPSRYGRGNLYAALISPPPTS